MKKLLLGILSCSAVIAYAQDLQTVQRSIASNDYLSARKEIDNYFNDKKNGADASAWYYKGRIYTEVVRQHDKSNYQTLQEALKSYKRYQELDPKNKMMQLNDNVDLFQLYDLSYNTAADYYNNKNYDLAYNHFKIALDAEEYILQKRFTFQGKTFPSLDTALINLIGSAAYLSNKEEEAIPYFEKLANAKISGDDYKGVYALLYQHYSKKNDPAKAARYLSMGKELFPDNEYWIKMEVGNAADDKTRFTRYEQLIQKYPANFDLMLDYAVELYNYVYAEPKPADFENRQSRLQTLLTKALSIDANSAMANFIMSQHVYSQVYYMEEALREMKEDTPAEVAKKKTFATKLDSKYEELLTYSLKAVEFYSKNSNMENRVYRRKALNQLITYYQKKKQGEKVQYYKEQLKGL